MKFFIFRNNTLENIFGTDEVEYSGYEDISYICLLYTSDAADE